MTTTLQRQFDQALEHARGVFQSASAVANAEGRDLTAAERSRIEVATKTARDLKARLGQARGDADITDQVERLTGSGFSPLHSGLSLGDQFMNSASYEWIRETRNSRAGKWTSPASELMAATITGDSASAGDLVITDYRPGIFPGVTRPLTMGDLFASGTTDSSSVTYMKEILFTNAAAAVAEGAMKPETSLVFDQIVDPVVKIAHWVPASEEILADASQLRSYIDARMRLGVLLTEDDQLLNGSGTLPNMRGILNRTGLTAAQARGADTNADAVAKQISNIFTATLLPPDGIVMHPTNWLTIQLSKDLQNNYLSGAGPFTAPKTPTLWGLPVAVTPMIALNTALVGAFKTAAQVFRRGGVRVDISNSHADFFVKNLVAIRAEIREALAVYRPSAFGTVTGLT